MAFAFMHTVTLSTSIEVIWHVESCVIRTAVASSSYAVAAALGALLQSLYSSAGVSQGFENTTF